MKKNGFFAISIIFSFFIVFIMVLTINIANYAQNRILMNHMKNDIKGTIGITTGDIKKICKRATTLHTIGSVTYGNLGTKGILISGDAFDCDVTGNGKIDTDASGNSTERFYYVSPLYLGGNPTEDDSWDDTVGVFIYFANTYESGISYTTTCAYNTSTNYNGPFTAKNKLPSNVQWNKMKLKNIKRNIFTEGNSQKISQYDYGDRSARLLTYQEVVTACGSNPVGDIDYLDNCAYLLENTKYSNSGYTTGYWLETPYSSNSTDSWVVNSSNNNLSTSTVTNSSTYGVRPAIEVPKSQIEY